MKKSELLATVSDMAGKRLVSREELNEAYATGLSGKEDHALRHQLNIIFRFDYHGR